MGRAIFSPLACWKYGPVCGTQFNRILLQLLLLQSPRSPLVLCGAECSKLCILREYAAN